MADDAHRYLGFAFASADLLFELNGEGKVTFALGAARQVAGVDLDALQGAALRDIISDEDQPTVAAFLGSLEPGDRRGQRLRQGARTGPATDGLDARVRRDVRFRQGPDHQHR